MAIKLAAIAACAAATVACSSSPDSASRADTTRPTVAIANNSSSTNQLPSVADPCPHDGKWALCGLERRLKQAGFVVKKVDSASTKRAGFSVRPSVYSLGQSRLEVFLYADSGSLNRDLAALDTLVVGPRGTPSQWGEVPPVFIRSANLGAVVLSTNPRQIERVMLAITAGPPQPGSPR